MEEGGRKPPFLICAKIVTSRSNNERPTCWPTARNTVVTGEGQRKLVSTVVRRDWNTVARTQPVLQPKSAKVERIDQPSIHKSTGPRTPQGKQRSKYNARKHGLFSKAVLLKGESRAEYESLLNGLMEDFQPQGKLETVLVEN